MLHSAILQPADDFDQGATWVTSPEPFVITSDVLALLQAKTVFESRWVELGFLICLPGFDAIAAADDLTALLHFHSRCKPVVIAAQLCEELQQSGGSSSNLANSLAKDLFKLLLPPAKLCVGERDLTSLAWELACFIDSSAGEAETTECSAMADNAGASRCSSIGARLGQRWKLIFVYVYKYYFQLKHGVGN
jgi:hypothetical protein